MAQTDQKISHQVPSGRRPQNGPAQGLAGGDDKEVDTTE